MWYAFCEDNFIAMAINKKSLLKELPEGNYISHKHGNGYIINGTYYFYKSIESAANDGKIVPPVYKYMEKESEYKEMFKTDRRYLYLLSTLKRIIKSDDTDKLDSFSYVIKVATDILCPVCLEKQEERPARHKDGLCSIHHKQQVKEQQIKGACESPGSEKESIRDGSCAIPDYRRRVRGKYPHIKDDFYPLTCTIPGCNEPHKSKGYCSLHWSRVYHSGIDPTDLEAMNRPRRITGPWKNGL